MSERFLEGFVVDLAKLQKLVGTPKLAAKAVRAKTNKHVLPDVDMTLGDGEEDDGKPITDAALAQLASGKVKKDNAYALARVNTIVLHAYAKWLGTIEVPYVAGDSFGLWNPVFKALGMKTIAKEYGLSSFAFPFKKSQNVDWPISTVVTGKSLAAWNTELAGDWAKKFPALPDAPFTDKKYGPNADEIAYAKADLPPAFATLKKWVATAVKAKQSLVLILDGDQ